MIDEAHSSGGRNAGQSLVEFALVFPILLLVIFAIIDGGRYVFAYNEVANAVRQGARAGIVANWPNPACTAPHAPCARLVGLEALRGLSGGQITVTCAPAACQQGAIMTVTGTAPVTFLTPAIGQFLGPRTVSATTKMTVES